ncbi:hypothetical protein Tco_1473787 [Tanacetum coccineum]
MTLHAVSRVCHHPDGLVCFPIAFDDMSGYIVGISRPSVMKSETEVIEGLVLDAELLDCVFKVPITTIKCIPHDCRLAFSQALKYVIYKVVTHPDSVDAWGGGDFLEERATGNTNIRECLRKVADGHFTSAVKVLSSSGVAPYCTSCGIDGLRAQHILDALCGEAEFVIFALLTPLLKPDNGIRPIVVGTIWRWLLGKYHDDGSLAMLTVDLSNAFNLVDRSALLHEQGDPLGTLLFALALNLLVHKTRDKIFWPSCNGVKLCEGLFPIEIQRSSLGVKLLGGAVSRDADFISEMAMRRAVNAVDLMSLLL